MNRYTEDWSVDDEDNEGEDHEVVEVLTDSETEPDLLDDDIEISVDESEYIDECPVNITHFDIKKILGSGAYGRVFLVKKNRGIDANGVYALKVINKEEIVKTKKTITHMKAERKVLELLRDCPYISKLYYAFQTDEKLFLVMEYLHGGELFTAVQKGPMDEELVRFYVAEVVVALEYIHKHNIVYRDIKLENLMIDKEGHINLVDFGLCKKLSPKGRTKSFCGTAEYMAPEIVLHLRYNTAVDWWSLGVLTVELLTTSSPFGANDSSENSDLIIRERIKNDSPNIPLDISPEMEDFILKLLTKDPAQRLGGGSIDSVQDVKNHPLFVGIDWKKVERKELKPPNNPPLIKNPFDTQNFSEDFTSLDPVYEPSSVPPNSFLTFKGLFIDNNYLNYLLQSKRSGYSYVAPELMENNCRLIDTKLDDPALLTFSNSGSESEVELKCDADAPFEAKYRLASDTPIGTGETSVCMQCFRLSDNASYAVKLYNKDKNCDDELNFLRKAALQKTSHIVRLIEVIRDSKYTYLIMELLDGIDILQYFSENSFQPEYVYNAFNALKKSVKSVHALGYTHGRICFQNFYFDRNSLDFRLIGLNNVKPVSNEQDKLIDFWSFGVCVYTVMCGHSPFDLLDNDLSQKIRENDFDTSSKQWCSLDKKLKSFIDQLICISKPTCTATGLKTVTRTKIEAITYSKKLVTQNEEIIALGVAVKLLHVKNDKKDDMNGMANGYHLVRSFKQEKIEPMNQIVDNIETQKLPNRRARANIVEWNGPNKSWKRRLEVENVPNNNNKRPKTKAVEPSAEQDSTGGGLRKKEQCNDTEAPTKIEEMVEGNAELPARKRRIKQPKNETIEPVRRGRPRKDARNAEATKKVPKKAGKVSQTEPSNSSKSTRDKQSVDYPRFLFEWQKKETKEPYYCFIRYDYKK
ncbi:Ribosomal protein S6 kinase alpha-5 [Pseudolycoriella hygida]|uniref:Ribosomal protein S6 kinase alpha-5 n=1 Tax=Pseudolycoriella hygida TaxID=35572 RepID=A0A9Q0N5S9_9DIPT|nr:Ribosomal protein S6 kinase alpha-5 [Pseudolycoriella hygida]